MGKLHESLKDIQRRNKYELFAETLELCQFEPRTQTWLMHELRVKNSVIKELLDFLIARELLSMNNSEEINFVNYQTTQKGKQALLQFYGLIENFFQKK